jgi:thiol:disulfide interchange protein DsbC
VSDLLKARLPKTEVGTMDCDKVAGLCEVVAGKSLFYVDHGARYLFIGRVYDMQTRQDLTAAKLLEINPGLLLGGAANAGAREEEGADRPPRPWPRMAGHCWPAQGSATGRRAPGGSLEAGAGRRGGLGKADGTPVTIFTDFHCGYCRALVNQLETMNVRVIERPISTLGSRDIANRVLCARDKACGPRGLCR